MNTLDLSEYYKDYKKWESKFWIGSDFGEAKEIKCIGIYQQHNQTYLKEDIDRWWFRALEVDLQSWLGLQDGWGEVDFSTDPLKAAIAPLLTTEQKRL